MNRAFRILALVLIVLAVAAMVLLIIRLSTSPLLIPTVDIKETELNEILTKINAGIDSIKYKLLVDLLTIILAALAVGLTAFGIGAYELLSRRIRDFTLNEVSRFTKGQQDAHDRLWLENSMIISYQKWLHWRALSWATRTVPVDSDMADIRSEFLTMAIEVCRKSLSKEGERLTSNEALKKSNKKQFEYDSDLVWDLKNNLAYLLAEKADRRDTADAQKFARQLYKEALSKTPAQAHYLDTCAYVFWKLPLEEFNEQKSRSIISQLLNRSDLKAQEQEWLHILEVKYQDILNP